MMGESPTLPCILKAMPLVVQEPAEVEADVDDGAFRLAVAAHQLGVDLAHLGVVHGGDVHVAEPPARPVEGDARHEHPVDRRGRDALAARGRLRQAAVAGDDVPRRVDDPLELEHAGGLVDARERDDLPFPNGLQGIGCFDGPLVGFLVEKNVVCVNHWHGITLGDAQGCTVRDNTAFSRWGGKAVPWVMLGQKKNLARGNTAQGNRAHSFSFDADPDVKAEDNEKVTEAIFRQRMAELSAAIDSRFGALHPAAKRPRLEPRSR